MCPVAATANCLVALAMSLAWITFQVAIGAPADAVTAPVIVVAQPADATVTLGQDATFESHARDAADAEVPVSSWQRNVDDAGWQDLPGTAGVSTLVIGSVSVAVDGERYRAVFDDGAGGGVTSNAARLDVNTPPIVTQQPLGVTVAPGGPFSLSLAGSGDPTPTVQWQRAPASTGPWTDVSGGTSNVLSAQADATPQTTVWFRGALTNPAGTSYSSAAAVTTSVALPHPVPSVSATNTAPGRLDATWSSPSGGGGSATGYFVEVKRDGATVTTLSTTSTSASFSLMPGTYAVSVTASNSAGSAAPTSSGLVSVHNLAVSGTASATSVYPFRDGFRDTVTLRATSNFAVSGRIRLITARGTVARTWNLAPGTSWAIAFSGRSAAGHPFSYGAYTIQFRLGDRTLPATALTIRHTEARVTSATWAHPTVYPMRDGYRDTVKLTIKTDMPATMRVTYTRQGSPKVIGTAKLARRTTGYVTWSARVAAKVVPAGRYRAAIAVKGGDGATRTYYRSVTVSQKKITASTFTGTISATGAYIATIAGSPVQKSNGRVELRWSSGTGADIALMGAQLPASFQNRYSGIALHPCVRAKFNGNAASVVLADAQVAPSSRTVDVPDSGCAQEAVPVSYVTDKQVYWFAGNFSGYPSLGVLDNVDLSLTRYLLK